MPLTISHPAAVIPLKKFGFPLSALIVGSMMPDFEFFLRLSSDRVIGHTIPGIFLFCLPVGFIVLLLFHIVIKKPVISLLPQSHHSRIFSVIGSEFRFFPLKQFMKIILALLIGIVSHLFLDSLTHDNSFFTSQIPLLSLSILTTPFGSLRVYFLLQQILSSIGFLLIIRWYFIWYRSSTPTILLPTPMRRNQKSKVLLCMGLLTLITTSIVVPVITFTGNTLHHTDLYRAIISNTAVVSVSVTLLVLFLYSICWHFFMVFLTKPMQDMHKE